MRRDRLVTLFVILASLTVCTVVTWLLFFRPVHEHTTVSPALIVVQPLSTPLRDSIREPAKKKGRHLSADSRTGGTLPDLRRSAPVTKSPTRLIKKRKDASKPKRRRKTPPHPQKSPTPATAPSTPPQKPLVGVTAPAPVSVCTGLVAVNC